MGPTSLASSSSRTQGDLRPMLGPILRGFRTVGLPDELKIIYCGAGSSIRTFYLARKSGGDTKEFGPDSLPYLEFPEWTGVDSIQSYINRFKDQLPDDESKARVDTLIPSAAVEMLHKRLKADLDLLSRLLRTFSRQAGGTALLTGSRP
jgi:hypothetical protein